MARASSFDLFLYHQSLSLKLPNQGTFIYLMREKPLLMIGGYQFVFPLRRVGFFGDDSAN
jgi:hypothetical protein